MQNHLLVVNCLNLFTFFYPIAFMQWFTEFMELFSSVWKLIKTLNLNFVCIFEKKKLIINWNFPHWLQTQLHSLASTARSWLGKWHPTAHSQLWHPYRPRFLAHCVNWRPFFFGVFSASSLAPVSRHCVSLFRPSVI